ncbi:MAG: type III pantothenate kinase [Campylobacterales bacterium]|nr:type III pantothenate kinase [Campylobacterales bacterium]
MILCDIGNSRYHFYYKGKIWHEKIDKEPKFDKWADGLPIYAISVQDEALERLQKVRDVTLINKYVDFDTTYQGIGVDRAVACLAAPDGVVVDAGSAITVDIMAGGIHLGGYILPGLNRYEKIYASISPKLAKSINMAVDIEALPQDTADAISYGIIASVVSIIQRSAKNKKIYFTGGDGAYFAKFFDNAMVDNILVFRGMEQIIEENNLHQKDTLF